MEIENGKLLSECENLQFLMTKARTLIISNEALYLLDELQEVNRRVREIGKQKSRIETELKTGTGIKSRKMIEEFRDGICQMENELIILNSKETSLVKELAQIADLEANKMKSLTILGRGTTRRTGIEDAKQEVRTEHQTTATNRGHLKTETIM